MKRRPQDDLDASLTRRTMLATFGVITLFSCVSARLVYVQHVEKERWTEKSNNRRGEELLPAARGGIFDTKGRLLAGDEMVQSVVFDNLFINEERSKGAIDRMAQALAKSEQRTWVEIKRTWSPEELMERYLNWLASHIGPIIGKEPREILRLIAERKDDKGQFRRVDEGETVLAKEIDAVQSGKLKKLMEEQPMGCLLIRSFFRRTYPTERPMTHVVGLVNSAGPVCGVEYARQDDLRGFEGRRVFEKDGRGQEVGAFDGELRAPLQGKSLRLTLDMGVQEIAEETLDEVGSDPDEVYIPNLKAQRVITVIMDARSLAIRAIACRNQDIKPGDLMLVNPALEEVYEPGSTIKPITMAAALDSGKVGPGTMIPTNRGHYDDDEIEPINDNEPFDHLSVTDILVHSSNIGAYKLARTTGLRKFYEYLQNFGFGAHTGIECRKESRGIFPQEKEWTLNVMSRCSFGYNISVTPVQMCAALGVIVNDGIYRKPYLVEAELDERNRVLSEHVQEEGRRVVSARAAKQTRDAMREVVSRGTGSRAESDDYKIAAKSGTTRKAGKNGYEAGKFVLSFLGFAPADKPKLIAVVIIDAPQAEPSQLYGGKLAAPVFRRLMERALRYYEVPRDLALVGRKSPGN